GCRFRAQSSKHMVGASGQKTASREARHSGSRSRWQGSATFMSECSPVVRVVDDDASFLMAVARLLKAAGYAVQTFASAADLLAKLGDTAGCVIAGLRVLGIGGLGLLHALVRGPYVPARIVLTGACAV